MDNLLIVFEYLRWTTIVFNLAFIILMICLGNSKKKNVLSTFMKRGIRARNNPYSNIILVLFVKTKIFKKEDFEKFRILHMVILGILGSVFLINIYIVHLMIKDVNEDL